MEKKRLLGTVGAIVLTAALTLGGTLAYLNSVTETKNNVFSSSKNIETILTEEDEWYNGWTDYTPGQSKPKTPVITNESKNTDIYVAMRVSYQGNNGDFMSQKDFEKFVTLENFNEEAKWSLLKTYEDGTALYLYGAKLIPGGKTDILFNRVTVNAGITGSVSQKYVTKKVYKVLADGTKELVNSNDTLLTSDVSYTDENGNSITDAIALPTFKINVKGFAVQATDGMTSDIINQELIKLSDANPDKK